MKKVFAIYDRKANYYGSLITCVNSDIAYRIVDSLLSENSSDYSKYPADFDLVDLGTFDDITGVLSSGTPAVVVNLASRLEYLRMLYLERQKQQQQQQQIVDKVEDVENVGA